jgi:hypothetical protein
LRAPFSRGQLSLQRLDTGCHCTYYWFSLH